MNEFTIDHARMEIISTLNRQSHHFKKLTDEIFYFDDKLGCWLSKKKDVNVLKPVGDEE